MSKIKLALSVVEDLKQLADSIQTLAKAMQEGEPKKKATVTIEAVRAVLASKTQTGKQSEVKALIAKYGADKLTDIDPKKYPELLAEGKAL